MVGMGGDGGQKQEEDTERTGAEAGLHAEVAIFRFGGFGKQILTGIQTFT